MTLDQDLVHVGRRLRDRLAELGAEADKVRADLRMQVGRLHAAGGAPDEIAAAVGIGEPQVREMLAAPAAEARAAAAEARAAAPDAVEPATQEFEPVPDAFEPLPDTALVGAEPPREAVNTVWTTLACSFCGASQERVGRLIAGPGVSVCDACARRALDLLVEGDDDDGRLRLVGGEEGDRVGCSFCGKRARRVGRLVAGSSGVHICGECLDLCTEILREERGR